jgi:hypothetical protein
VGGGRGGELKGEEEENKKFGSESRVCGEIWRNWREEFQEYQLAK